MGVAAPKGSSNPRFTNPATSFVWTDQTGLSGGGISGDHRTGSGAASGDATSTYEDGKCGVASNLWLSRWGDATNNPIDAKRGCGAARFLVATFGTPLGSGSPTLPAASGGHFANLHQAACSGSVFGANLLTADFFDCLIDPFWSDPANNPWEPTAAGIPGAGSPNRPAERVFRIILAANSSYCEAIRYAPATIGGVTGRPVLLTRVASVVWLATSQPDGSGRHVAFCERAGVLVGAYDIPFRVEVRQK